MRKKLIMAVIAFCLLLSAASQNHFITFFDVQPALGCSIFIQWNADAKSDTVDFIVERSADKYRWQTLSVQKHLVSHRYSSFDNEPLQGYNYYRIRRAGKQDSLSVTAVKWVQLNKNTEIFIWPNPVREVIHVKTPSLKGSIDIVDSNGKLILTIVITDFFTTLPAAPLAAGIYFLHIKYDNREIIEQFIKE